MRRGVTLDITRTGRCKRFGGLISLFPTAHATFIVLNSQTDVKTYLLDDAGLGQQVDRPSCCKYCKSNRMPHRHGKFERWLYTLRERVLLSVSRFLCFDCKRTMSVMPDVAEAHHQTAVDVKEEVIRLADDRNSVPSIAARSKDLAGGPYSEKTLRRWIHRWRQRFAKHLIHLWAILLHAGIDRGLPRERHSDFRALSIAWKARHIGENLFSRLLRLDRASPLAVSLDHPTEAGHGSVRRLPRQ